MKRILIVEDQADIRRLIRFALKPTKSEVREAVSGQEGLDAIRESPFDLVLLDIRMPGDLNGFEVCQRIRLDAANQKLPVLILSADAFESDREMARQAGATGFLAKPFSPLELMKRVEHLLLEGHSHASMD